MDRRTFLSLGAGTLAATAGCLDSTTTDGSTPTDTSFSTPTPTDVGSLTVGIDRLQLGAVAYTYPDSIGVVNTDRQYLYATVEATESPPAVGEFTLQFDGESHDPLTQESSPFDSAGLYNRWAGAYSADSPDGWLLFELPTTGESSDAALVWPDGEWSVPESIRTRLSTPAPQLSVTVGDTEPMRIGDNEPERVTIERTSDVGLIEAPTVTITNEGDQPRRYLGAINQQVPSYAPVGTTTGLVAGGETVTTAPNVAIAGSGGTVEARYSISFGANHAEVTVRKGETVQQSPRERTRSPAPVTPVE